MFGGRSNSPALRCRRWQARAGRYEDLGIHIEHSVAIASHTASAGTCSEAVADVDEDGFSVLQMERDAGSGVLQHSASHRKIKVRQHAATPKEGDLRPVQSARSTMVQP